MELGAGTGLLLNKYASKVKSVVALEKFSDFSKFIQKADNVEIIHEDIVDFETPKEFDFVLIFGVMNYFNEEESKIIYQKCLKWLKKGGKLVVKNQFGVKEDVTIEEYSSEQEALYYSQYRFIDKEAANLAQMGFKNIKVVDIYPPECNRWDNTHFYAIVAEKL